MSDVTPSARPEFKAVFEAIRSRREDLRGKIADNKNQVQALLQENTEFEGEIATLDAEEAKLSAMVAAPAVAPARTNSASRGNAQESLDLDSLPESLRDYAKSSEKGRGVVLASADMITDVVGTFDRPTARKEILTRFFERFPRHDLASVWEGNNIEGTVSVALRRAVQRGTVIQMGKGEYAPKDHTSAPETDGSQIV